jgi:hypothetical protein
MVQQHMHWTFIYTGHALLVQVFYYALLRIVCDFNADEIFLWKPKRLKQESCMGLFY